MAKEWIEVVVGDKDSEGYKKITEAIEQGYLSQAMDIAGVWYDSKIDIPLCGTLYRYKDPYYELKQAKEEGKIIQSSFFPKADYVDVDYPDWSYPVDHYRIKPEETPFPKLMVQKKEHRNAGMVVYMHEDATGPVVYAPEGCGHAVDYKPECWSMNLFEDFELPKENDNA